eukprot:UN31134
MTFTEDILQLSEDLPCHTLPYLSSNLKHLNRIPEYRDVVLTINDELGLPQDQINIVVILLAQIPLSLIYRMLPGGVSRQIYGTLLGVFQSWLILGCQDIFVMFGFMFFMYPIVKYTNTKITLFISTVAIASGMAYFAYYEWLSYRITWTTVWMAIFVKANFLAGDLKAAKDLKTNKDMKWRIKEKKQQTAVDEISFWTYVNYMCFYLHVFFGSSHGLRHYLNHVNPQNCEPYSWSQKVLDKWRPIIKKNDEDQCFSKDDAIKLRIHIMAKDNYSMCSFNFTALISCILKATIPLFITLNLRKYLSSELFMTPEFQAENYVYKWLAISIYSAFYRYQFYVVWGLLEVAAIVSGCGFQGVLPNGSSDCTALHNIEWPGCDIFPNTTIISNCWNIPVSRWLRDYVFYGVALEMFPRAEEPTKETESEKKARKRRNNSNALKQRLTTRLASAFFHGLYPGYVLFLFLLVLQNGVCPDGLVLLGNTNR